MEAVTLAEWTRLGVVSFGGHFDENAEKGNQFGSNRLFGVLSFRIWTVGSSWRAMLIHRIMIGKARVLE